MLSIVIHLVQEVVQAAILQQLCTGKHDPEKVRSISQRLEAYHCVTLMLHCLLDGWRYLKHACLHQSRSLRSEATLVAGLYKNSVLTLISWISGRSLGMSFSNLPIKVQGSV